jgi:hypothetical protein
MVKMVNMAKKLVKVMETGKEICKGSEYRSLEMALEVWKTGCRYTGRQESEEGF